MSEKAILRLIPTMESIGLVSGFISKKKRRKKKIVKNALNALVGIPIISETASQVESF